MSFLGMRISGNCIFIKETTVKIILLFREISVRIAAIRETFEELGLLLVKNRDQLCESKAFSMHCRELDIPRWQSEVIEIIEFSVC